MRKNINGLSAIVYGEFKLDPLSGALFVFCNGTRKILKVLEWAGDGFWLHTKRLERERFKWPEVCGGEPVMPLNELDLHHLLGGPGLEQKLRRTQVESKMAL
jgi:transposase